MLTRETRRIFVLFISLFLLHNISLAQVRDSIMVKEKIGFGIELSGPIIHSIDNNNLNLEARLSYRLNYKYYIVAEPGIAQFSYSQYNYDYSSEGFFIRAGVDINLLKTKPAYSGRNHFAGIGLRYGLSLFNQETPSATFTNYWGGYDFSLERELVNAHFLEINGGVKAELFRNILIGWTVRGRLILYQSAGKTRRPLMIPGAGGGDGGLQPGFSYHLIWLIPSGSRGN